MFRRLALLLIALSLTLAPLWSPAIAAHAHEAMAMVSSHGAHDHCDQAQAPQPKAQPPQTAADCATCPCAVGLAAIPALALGTPAVFGASTAGMTADLPPRPHQAAPSPRPPRT